MHIEGCRLQFSMPRVSILSLRPSTAADEPFLRALYAETRAREMDATGWPADARAAFLRGQFDAQQRGYRGEFPEASFDVVLAAGKPVGRLYVARLPDAVAVVEITLLASCQSRGWGTALLRQVVAEGDRLGLPTRLQVDANNRAQRLYRRLGFQETGRTAFRLCMERPAA